jgi:hypothetical protein
MLPDAVRRRVDTLLASVDPLDREVGRRLLSRLPELRPVSVTHPADTDRRPSRWRHVPMADVLERAGNHVQMAGDRLKSGHEPVHGSRSGACLVVWPADGRWWCSSCGRAGDAVGLVMGLLGVSARDAMRLLSDRYGAPPEDGTGSRRVRRPRRRPYNAAVLTVRLGEGRCG